MDSGVVASGDRLYYAVDRLRRLASEVSVITPHSLTGLVIKVEAIMAYAACDGEATAWAVSYARKMPSDILGLFGSGEKT
ncbi:MAG TPA: hypothetical protein VGO22_00270 [Pseudorhizobium sp.]|nr:hypothetical protein [Pseudorhizobium sp.]